MAKNLAKLFAAELEGIKAKLIEVEVDINVGLHSFNIVGLADKALSEAKERVNSALKNSGLKPPNKENRRITVNLAPADIKKTGSQYDLTIAVGYLLATKQIKDFNTKDKIFIGELSLDGTLKPINGSLSISQFAKKLGFNFLFLPKQNAIEAAIIKGVKIIPVSSLEQLINHLEEKEIIKPLAETKFKPAENKSVVDISEIKGQENAKRALMVAASGNHHLLMIGPPGTGKTMLAQALVSILPPLSLEEAIEATRVHSAASMLEEDTFINFRPFRSPHHTASPASLVGGGQSPRPGEISLSHRGVLFLDELPEFRRDVLEALRQPLENGKIVVSRAKSTLTFPAKFCLVAAMNPCPCGYFNDPEIDCKCGAAEVFRYRKKVSGPLLDRIDIQIEVPRVKIEDIIKKSFDNKITEEIRNKVIKTRQIQVNRFSKIKPKIYANAEMSSRQADDLIILTTETESFLKKILEKNIVSGRGYYRILKIARTIADLEESEKVKPGHIAEAFGYRVRENEGVGYSQ